MVQPGFSLKSSSILLFPGLFRVEFFAKTPHIAWFCLHRAENRAENPVQAYRNGGKALIFEGNLRAILPSTVNVEHNILHTQI